MARNIEPGSRDMPQLMATHLAIVDWVSLNKGDETCALSEAWLGEETTARTNKSIIDIDECLPPPTVPLGWILLRQELLNMRTLLESYASIKQGK